jgi:hypothetical protein
MNMNENQYSIDIKNGRRVLSFVWRYPNNTVVERFVTDSNPNAFNFMIDMLDRLGYTFVR